MISATQQRRRIQPGAGQIVLRPAAVAAVAAAVPGDQLRGLYELSDPALSELGLDQLLDELLVRVRDALGVDTVAILLLDEPTGQLVARAAKGIEEEVERGVRIPLGKGFAGRIAVERARSVIADVDHADILNPILREKGIRSLLGVPLIVEGQLIGVLHVGSLRPREFERARRRRAPARRRRAAARRSSARGCSLQLEREHELAMCSSGACCRERLVEPDWGSVAARYMPARDEVGGDWYDVIELPRGLIGVAIGDVVGHGVRAAPDGSAADGAALPMRPRAMTRLATLELVDRYSQSIGGPAMATAAYAVFDTDGDSSCGSQARVTPADRDRRVARRSGRAAAARARSGRLAYRPLSRERDLDSAPARC